MELGQPKVTLLEILVIVAIIGIIGVLAVFAVNAARSKERDSTRIANVRQVQSALEDFFNERNTYPEGDATPLGDSSVSACLGTNGFQRDCSSEKSILMRFVPRMYDDGLKGIVTCGNPTRNAFCYNKTSSGDSYIITFELENGIPAVGLRKGMNCAMPGKMQAGNCQ